MGKLSKIEWTHHTFNPWMGCTKVSPACDNCYAEKLVTGRMGLKVWGKDAERKETPNSYWHQPFAWDRAAERAGERHRVFCGSLCDVMEDRKDLNRIRGDLYKLIESTPNLDWLLLTKRPQNFRRFLPAHWIESPRPNVWGMTTVESAEQLWRVAELLATPFAVRGLSMEPLLGPVDLRQLRPNKEVDKYIHTLRHPEPRDCGCGLCAGHPKEIEAFAVPLNYPQHVNALTGQIISSMRLGYDGPRIDWVIVGGESGPGARPIEASWAQSLRDQCVAAGVAFFFKQWGEHLPAMQDGAIVDGHQIVNSSDRPERIGKKRAGRLLDGREWNEVPSGAL